MATTISFKYNNKMPCSNCGTEGHNIRTCRWKKPVKKTRVYERLKRDIKDCCVCYEQLETGNGTVTTPCGHNYCTPCFANWMRKSGTCAYCREEVCEAPKQFASDISDEVQEQIIDHLLEDDSLVADVVGDIQEQVVRGIQKKYGINTPGVDSMINVINDIMENFEPYFIMSIVAHETTAIVSESIF
jgi:hypothetical protein